MSLRPSRLDLSTIPWAVHVSAENINISQVRWVGGESFLVFPSVKADKPGMSSLSIL
jgi:hypothetical protein